MWDEFFALLLAAGVVYFIIWAIEDSYKDYQMWKRELPPLPPPKDTPKCPYCKSANSRKMATVVRGAERYACRDCGSVWNKERDSDQSTGEREMPSGEEGAAP